MVAARSGPPAARAQPAGAPGNVTVLAGSDVTVSGLDLGRGGQALNVSFNLSGNFWKTEPATSCMVPRRAGCNRSSRLHVQDIRNTTSYYFERVATRRSTPSRWCTDHSHRCARNADAARLHGGRHDLTKMPATCRRSR